jgi:hypothetical protein
MSLGKLGSKDRYASVRMVYLEGIMLRANAIGNGIIDTVPLRVPVTSLGCCDARGLGWDCDVHFGCALPKATLTSKIREWGRRRIATETSKQKRK